MDKDATRFKTYTHLEKTYQKILAKRLPLRRLRKVQSKYKLIAVVLTNQARG